jgi:hypothetical protein
MGRQVVREDVVRRGRTRRRGRCICYYAVPVLAPAPDRVVKIESGAEILYHHKNPVAAVAVVVRGFVGKMAPSVCVSACVWAPFDSLSVLVKVREMPWP